MATDWRKLVASIEPRARTTTTATEEIAEAESAIGAAFPKDLKALFLQTNGIQDDRFGPVLPLSSEAKTSWIDVLGLATETHTFPKHDYSITQYTLLQRTLWEEDAGIILNNFVVVGVNIGGNPLGFFAGAAETTRIESISHDDASQEENDYRLEDYLRTYFAECGWFTDKTG